jgi:hypothetical protein
MYRYLKIAEDVRGISIIPVPVNNYSPENQGDTIYSDEELITIIDNQSKVWR